MIQMNKTNQKKLWTSLAVVALLGIAGTTGVITSQKNTSSEPDIKVEQKSNKVTNKKGKDKEKSNSSKKKSTDSLVKETYDQFDIQNKQSSMNSTNSTSSLTPNELRTVANVIKQQQQNKEQQETVAPPVTIPTVSQKEKPDTPKVVPPVPTSKPEINYQKGIVVVKGNSFNPYEYFEVEDTLDPNVSVFVDTTGMNMLEVGPQSFIVIATNKFGESAVVKIPVFVASQPDLTVNSDNIEVTIGSEFYPLDFVQAFDELDGNITGNISVVSSTVDVNKEGIYSVQYSVQNSYGIATTLNISVQIINGKPNIVAPEVTHEINQEFDALEGVSAIAFNGETIPVSDIRVVENNVDIHTEGTYSVSYQVSDRFGKESDVISRRIIVENAAPVLEGVSNLEIPLGTNLTEEMLTENVRATDREDNKQNLTVEVKLDQVQFEAINTNVPGNYALTYIAVDSMGKTTKKEIVVAIVGTKPVIHGVEDKKIELNQKFDPLEGVSVTDAEDGTISVSTIELTGAVDTTKSGEYILTYQVKDSDGQESDVYTRKITVKGEETSAYSKSLDTIKPFIEDSKFSFEKSSVDSLSDKTRLMESPSVPNVLD